MYNERYTAKQCIDMFHKGAMEMLNEIDQMMKDKKKSGDNDESTISAYTQKIMVKHFSKNLGVPLG